MYLISLYEKEQGGEKLVSILSILSIEVENGIVGVHLFGNFDITMTFRCIVA